MAKKLVMCSTFRVHGSKNKTEAQVMVEKLCPNDKIVNIRVAEEGHYVDTEREIMKTDDR
jgi:hypothetical protein